MYAIQNILTYVVNSLWLCSISDMNIIFLYIFKSFDINYLSLITLVKLWVSCKYNIKFKWYYNK